MDAIAAGVIRNRRISSLRSFVAERLMMLLNVGVPTSAIQLIVCVVPIDAFDRSDHFVNGHAGLVRSTTRRWDLSGHSRLRGGADLVRKTGIDQETMQFETPAERSNACVASTG